VSHRRVVRSERHDRRAGLLAVVAVLLAAATAAGIYVLRPTGQHRPDINQFGAVKETFPGRVESTRVVSCQATGPESRVSCVSLTIRILEGPDKGQTFAQQLTFVPGSPRPGAGDEVVVGHQENAPSGFEYAFVDYQRRAPLLWLTAIFGSAVLVLGRFRGAASLVGLGASLAVLLVFVVPAILDGRDPVAVALVGASAIAFLALYLAHGFSRKTTVALLGTLGGLGVTAILAEVFQGMTHLTGLASEEGRFLQAVGVQVSFAGLMLGGVIIGALGAIDDITVTQASAIWELKEANQSLSGRHLYRSGMRIGRDHVASTVNTLALAYLGASMPILLLFVLSNQSLGTVANGEIIATEVFRTLVGSIGLIASVPLTTLLAVRFARVSRRPRPGAPFEGPGEPFEPSPGDDEIRIPERRRDAFLDALRGRPGSRP
jgi:uncharacterized membrane protein